MSMGKACSECNVLKPITEFWKNRRSPDGYLQKCKECAKPSSKQKFLTHIKYHYNVTEEVWHQMIQDQSGLCQVCDTPMDDPVIDHCHKSGRVRGLLCRFCNIAAGALRDNPEAADRLASYLRLHND